MKLILLFLMLLQTSSNTFAAINVASLKATLRNLTMRKRRVTIVPSVAAQLVEPTSDQEKTTPSVRAARRTVSEPILYSETTKSSEGQNDRAARSESDFLSKLEKEGSKKSLHCEVDFLKILAEERKTSLEEEQIKYQILAARIALMEKTLAKYGESILRIEEL